MKGDGNIASILQWVMADLHVTGIEAVVRRYIIDAMTFHRNKRYFFSDRRVQFNLTSGRSDYKPGDGFGLPSDLVEISSRVIWILITGSNDQRKPCIRASTNLFEEMQAAWGNSSSYPDYWDFRAGALRFSPTPQYSTDVVELKYLTNVGIPRITYENGAFAFYHPTTGEDISSGIDAWSNEWTSQEAGAAAIRLRAMYMTQKNYLKDMEGAQDTLTSWLEAVGQLEDETESKQAGVTYLEGTILD